MSGSAPPSPGPNSPDASLPNHHYVPKFILKNFASAKTGNRVALYDKQLKRVELKGVRKAATEPGYNTQADGTDPVEQFLSGEFETPAAAAVASLVSGTPVHDVEEKGTLALRKLLIAQVLRSPRARRTISDMIKADPPPGASRFLDFDDSGNLTRDGLLQATAAMLRGWKWLGPASWPLKLASCHGSATRLFVPDNGALLHHPDLRSQGWIDSSIDGMASLFMPLSPTLALVALNPDFSFEQSMPAWEEIEGLTWGQADKFIYGHQADRMDEKFSTMISREP